MTTSLIVTTYNRPDALAVVLKSALRQKRLPEEIIVADDGSDERTGAVIRTAAAQSPIPILHAWQPDEGFRAAMARNRAIALASGDYIIMIDGDMVLHPSFILDHLRAAERKTFIQGGRVLLDPNATQKTLESGTPDFSPFSLGIGNRKNALHAPLLGTLLSRKTQTLRGIKTCNFALFREDILAVNGFDNRFVGWGREDSEFAVRLLNQGILRKNINFSAIAFHLYHEERDRISLPTNEKILQRSIKLNIIKCDDGINRFIVRDKG
jgi:glycosyltransferase involved in cell wall biosynthesis